VRSPHAKVGHRQGFILKAASLDAAFFFGFKLSGIFK
jgi:hypothetical protein